MVEGHNDEDHHHHDRVDSVRTDHGIRGRGNFIIAGLTSGHGVFHWFLQSFIVLLPEIETAFALTKVGVGSISTTREMVSGLGAYSRALHGWIWGRMVHNWFSS